jgi:hypothetical protein
MHCFSSVGDDEYYCYHRRYAKPDVVVQSHHVDDETLRKLHHRNHFFCIHSVKKSLHVDYKSDD